ncbi:MAG TPA: 2-phosphosulfolactate phosphatase [candidate division Zixibacteria bacterium]|nr:2-phosphosulfolactate phosphatase [candidate division Zixibacteria bacterium]
MFRVFCEWGPNGVARLSDVCEVTVIVDVLSFSTSVDIAANRSIKILPYSGPMAGAQEFAEKHDAELARHRGKGGFSLSPYSFSTMPYVSRIVLPSPNGSTLTLLAAESSIVLCGCLRNAKAIAKAIAKACLGYESIGIIPAGERWPDGSLRPALEDWLGAGAIISSLKGSWSPEARAAAAAFGSYKDDLLAAICSCLSGKELIDGGYRRDVEIACDYGSSDAVPRFSPPAYQNAAIDRSLD